ncbi:MAG TPA: DUF3068 domain-containing protein [Aldersonia sp.]
MADRSGSRRTLACILVGLGAFCLVAAILIPTYTVSKLAKTPLDLEVTTVATGEGADVLVAASLASPTGSAVVDHDVPLVSQRFLTVEDPSDATKMTLQAGQTLRRTDKQGDTGLLTAVVDRVTIDRNTGMPVDDPIGTIQVAADTPGQEVSHTGLQYRFPFGTEKKSYPYFDLSARESKDIEYVDETEINGLTVYHFSQEVGPIDLYSVVPSATNRLSLPAAKWGVEGGETPVTMTRWYTNKRDVWVEPTTGVVVKGAEVLHQYYARNADQPEVDVLKDTLTFDENTIESQAEIAKDGMDTLSLFGRTLPIILGILGVILLVVGVLLGIRGGRGRQGATPAHAAPSPSGGASAAAPPQSRDWTKDKTDEIPRPGS